MLSIPSINLPSRYTTEVTQALHAFALKIQRLKETQQSLTVELDSSQRDVNHLHQKCNDATMSQQDVNKELALVRQEKASTDIQLQDLVQRYKLLMEDLGEPIITYHNSSYHIIYHNIS